MKASTRHPQQLWSSEPVPTLIVGVSSEDGHAGGAHRGRRAVV